MSDFRFAFRQLQKNLGFTTIAVLTLALGIGACVSICSVANAMLLRHQRYQDPGRLVWVWQRNLAESGSWLAVSAPNFGDWQQQASAFEQLAAFYQRAPDLEHTQADAAPAERVGVGRVTVNLLSMLGVKPLMGRTFLPEDEKNQVVVLSHALWQRRFNAHPNMLDRTVRLNGKDYAVIGIMPPEVHFPPEPG